MLITAGSREKHNCMTASWGGVGVLEKNERSLGIIGSISLKKGSKGAGRRLIDIPSGLPATQLQLRTKALLIKGEGETVVFLQV